MVCFQKPKRLQQLLLPLAVSAACRMAGVAQTTGIDCDIGTAEGRPPLRLLDEKQPLDQPARIQVWVRKKDCGMDAVLSKLEELAHPLRRQVKQTHAPGINETIKIRVVTIGTCVTLISQQVAAAPRVMPSAAK